MEKTVICLQDYYVYTDTYEDFMLVLNKTFSLKLNERKWVNHQDYPLYKYLFFDDACQESLNAGRNTSHTDGKRQLLPQEYVDMLDNFVAHKEEDKVKSQELPTLDKVFVHVPFVAITEVLLEAAGRNELAVSQYIKGHKYLYCKNDKIEGAHDNPGALRSLQEVGVNEFMQLILDQNKIVSVKLNDNVEVFISNKGKKIEFSFDKQKRESVSVKMIDELKLFLQHKESPKFQAGEYCVFPSSDIRRAFAKEVKHSDIRGAEIIETCGSERVLFYEFSAGSIWLKKDEDAYKAYEPQANRISMDEFAERLEFKQKLQLFNYPVTKIGENIIKFGCQEVSRENLGALFSAILQQRGEATAMAS